MPPAIESAANPEALIMIPEKMPAACAKDIHPDVNASLCRSARGRRSTLHTNVVPEISPRFQPTPRRTSARIRPEISKATPEDIAVRRAPILSTIMPVTRDGSHMPHDMQTDDEPHRANRVARNRLNGNRRPETSGESK